MKKGGHRIQVIYVPGTFNEYCLIEEDLAVIAWTSRTKQSNTRH